MLGRGNEDDQVILFIAEGGHPLFIVIGFAASAALSAGSDDRRRRLVGVDGCAGMAHGEQGPNEESSAAHNERPPSKGTQGVGRQAERHRRINIQARREYPQINEGRRSNDSRLIMLNNAHADKLHRFFHWSHSDFTPAASGWQ